MVVVTGAAGGLGSAVCTVLEREGATVVGVDLHGEVTLTADVGTENGARSMIDETVRAYGRLDALVLNAGVQHMAPIDEFPLEEWDRVLSVLLRGPFIAIKRAWPHLKASSAGRIVVTASASSFVAEAYKSAYVAAKHGVAGLVKVVAIEGAPFGITANAVAPGLMLTPLIENQIADQQRLHGVQREEVLARFLARGPADRAVETTEVAEVIAFLLCERASGVNGAVVPVDLGLLAC